MEKLRELIKHHEGCVLEPYKDSRGYLTIGVGRLLDPTLGGGISQDEADLMLDNDIRRCFIEANRYPWFHKLNEPRRAVIISMLFNLGKPRWDKFVKTQAYLAEGNFGEAAHELLRSKWAGQVGKRSVDLAMMLENGEWND